MPETWPAQLPQKWPLESEEEPRDPRQRFDGFGGPPRYYNEFTAAETVHRIPPLTISEAQRTVLETFFRTTLNNGTDPFEWTDPYAGAGTKTFQFKSRPKYQRHTPRVDLPSEYRAGSSNPLAILSVVLELEEWPWYPA